MTTPRAAAKYDCFAIAAPGLETLVAHELTTLGVAAAKAVPGGVEFTADAARLASVQLRTRTASRVIVRLAQFRATAFHELERAARQVEWGRVLPPGATFRMRVTCKKSRLYHSDAVAERVAAAIVRSVKGATFEQGVQPDDDRDETADVIGDLNPATKHASLSAANAISKGVAKAVAKAVAKSVAKSSGPGPEPTGLPAQLFVVRFDHDECTISADASGDLLHRRGYRLAVGRAPLRETLAAAMLIGAEWDAATPLVDPMCGSGTIPIEAAMIARRIAPGLARPFAAERWPETPADAWPDARLAAKREILPKAPAAIVGVDRDEGAIANALANAKRMGVLGDVEFRCAALSALEVPDARVEAARSQAPAGSAPAGAPRGLLIANPPYGVRVGDSKPLRDLFARFGQVAREKCDGWRVAVLSADRALDAQTKLPFTQVFATSNGGIAVRLVAADVGAARAGSARVGAPKPGTPKRGATKTSSVKSGAAKSRDPRTRTRTRD